MTLTLETKNPLGGEDKETYELSRCPFCGGDVARFATCHEVEACGDWCPTKGAHTAYTVVCSFLYGGCGSSSGFYPTRAEAAGAWNRRQP